MWGNARARAHKTKIFCPERCARIRKNSFVTPKEAERYGLSLNKDGQRRTAFELLSYPNVTISDLKKIWPRFDELPAKIAEQIEIDAKYDVYLSRQAADIAAYRRDESFELPDNIDYTALPGLSNEMKQKLQTHRPRTIGHAGPYRRHNTGGAYIALSHTFDAAKKLQQNLREHKRAGASMSPILLSIKRAHSRSFLFHVKRKPGSTFS